MVLLRACVHVFTHTHRRGNRAEREITAIREEREGERKRAHASEKVVDVRVSYKRGPRDFDAQGREGGRKRVWGVYVCAL